MKVVFNLMPIIFLPHPMHIQLSPHWNSLAVRIAPVLIIFQTKVIHLLLRVLEGRFTGRRYAELHSESDPMKTGRRLRRRNMDDYESGKYAHDHSWSQKEERWKGAQVRMSEMQSHFSSIRWVIQKWSTIINRRTKLTAGLLWLHLNNALELDWLQARGQVRSQPRTLVRERTESSLILWHLQRGTDTALDMIRVDKGPVGRREIGWKLSCIGPCKPFDHEK